MRTESNTLQLQFSIILGLMTLIPNNALRYTACGITLCLVILFDLHLKRPATRLRQLENSIQETEGIVETAKSRCPRDQHSLVEECVRLLRAKRSASIIQVCILETKRLTWKRYRLLSRDIAECTETVKRIRTAVQVSRPLLHRPDKLPPLIRHSSLSKLNANGS
ncbi:hypothetical protein FB451DRAFT_1220173 [Mycena latifolia]|nr:hypothetical protein FB451DRAFT_1220173 [Mycena latifolia]